MTSLQKTGRHTTSLFEQTSDIALRSLREPLTGLAALLGMLCDASHAALAAVYLVLQSEGNIRFLTASGPDSHSLARLRTSTPELEGSLRLIAETPSGRLSLRTDLSGPWGAHVVSAASVCPLPEGVSVLLIAGGSDIDLAEIEQYTSAVALLACASATRDTMGSLRKQLQELRQERALLAAGLQHDLKTPITSVLGAAGMLSNGMGKLSASEEQELLEMIKRQGHRMKDMISTALSSASDAHEADPIMRDAGAHEIARRVSQVALMAREGDVAIEVPQDLVLRTDPARLERILLNLLDNALKYAPAGTRVHLIGERRADQVTLTVADLGAGVNSAILATLFSAYATDPSRDGGTGLGLNNASRLAASLGGGISYSRAGGWTRFTVTLPDPVSIRCAG